MEIDVVQIGTFGEIRIPQRMLTQCQIGDRVELQIEGGRMVLQRPGCRVGWAEAFAVLGAEQRQLLPEPALSSFDDEEWEW